MLGADHHGYVGRLKAIAACAGDDPEHNIEVLIGQLITLDGAKLSKRAGNIVEMRDLIEWIGIDAVRYSLARYPADSPLNLDGEQLRKRTQRQPGVLRAVRARPDRRMSRARGRGRRAPRGRLRPVAADHETESALLGAARRVPAGGGAGRRAARAAPRRALPRGARRRRTTSGTTRAASRPQGDEQVTDLHRTRLWLNEATRPVLGQRPGPARASRRRSRCSARARGRRAARRGLPRPAAWLRPPDDVNALVAAAVVAHGPARRARRRAQRGGRRRRDLAAEHGTPAYVVDEADFRAGPGTSRRRSTRRSPTCAAAPTSTTRARRSCAPTVARWVAEEGLGLDTCTGGELAVALRAGFPAERIGLHGNNKCDAELGRALDAGVGRIVLDSLDRDRPGRRPRRRARGAGAGACCG